MRSTSNNRRLRIEPLEDRRMLAVLTVQNNLDDTLANLAGDGQLSLREAIHIANNPGTVIDGFVSNDAADEIRFDFGHDGPEIIRLNEGELVITSEMTIAGDGPELLTIDASGNDPTPYENNGDGSRIFDIDDGNNAILLNISIQGLTLTGGDLDDGGGAIRSREHLSIIESTISGNAITSALGRYAGGGIGIRYGDLYLSKTTMSGNVTDGNGNLPGGAISAHDSNVTIVDSELSNNRTMPGQSQGGAIAVERGNLSVVDSLITGNSTSGQNSRGGATYVVVGDLNIQNSSISGNFVYGNNAGGGGIYHSFGEFTLTNSTISGNSTLGNFGFGGGIYALNSILRIYESTISDNHANGIYAQGGGLVLFRSDTIISGSTISNNTTWGRGGGIFSDPSSDETTIINSTISGNEALVEEGGGIYVRGRTVLEHSTVTENTAPIGLGSGIASRGISSVFAEVSSSTIANNTSEDVAVIEPTIGTTHKSFVSLGYNLIGTGNSFDSGSQSALDSFNQSGDQVGILDPLLGPLADNGGPTKTHALLPGSPALDAGDPSIAFDPNEFDQRGNPFTRVAAGVISGVPPTPRIDIGSYEAQAPPSADFNNDLRVDGRDFLSWQLAFGQSDGGDSDHDGDTDLSDLAAWQLTYGDTIILPPLTAALATEEAVSTAKVNAVDAVLSLDMFDIAPEVDSFLLIESTSAEVTHDVISDRHAYHPNQVCCNSTSYLDTSAESSEQEEAAEILAILLASVAQKNL